MIIEGLRYKGQSLIRQPLPRIHLHIALCVPVTAVKTTMQAEAGSLTCESCV